MKKLSEVCKIVGVTRRTLMGYDEIGLLHPTDKTVSGYWLYDEEAIQKLIVIQIFVEGGYERKAIKAVLESPTLDIYDEFDRLIETLELKKKRIEGMINTINSLKVTAQLPECTLKAISTLDLERIYHDKSFSSYLKDAIAHSIEGNALENEEAELYIRFWYNLIAIGCFLGTPPEDEEVQTVVEEAYKSMIQMLETDEENEEEQLSEGELAETFAEAIQEMFQEMEVQKMIEDQCGARATEYIIQAVQVFNNKTNTQKGEV